MNKRSQKRWRYRQITAVAEGRIRADMQEAKGHRARAAWGGYCGWVAPVAGDEDRADHECLRAPTGSWFKPATAEAQS